MKPEEQKLIINNLLSSGEIYAKCAGILSSEYFVPEYRKTVQFIKEYVEKYGALPDFDLVNAKDENLSFARRTITTAEVASTCDDIELFCQQGAAQEAVVLGYEDALAGNLGSLMERVKKASLVSLQRDMGVDMFDNPEEYLLSLVDTDIYYSTGIQSLDDNLDGGIARKQFTLFSANSGGGKSVMLSNLGVNFVMGHGMNVVYISLELAEPMIFKRNAFIMTGVSSKAWKEKIGFISSKINSIKADGAGSFRVKRLPTGCCVNDIRAYLKQYETEFNYKPDVIILDYLDLLSPNEGTKNLDISAQDKQKAEQFSQLLHDYNAIGLSASQQNREALTNQAPTQGVIAGGMTKVNTVDNFISLFMDGGMRAKGEMMAFFLKTRSSDGVGKMVMLSFDSVCLRIGDLEGSGGGMTKLIDNIAQRKQRKKEAAATGVKLEGSIGDLPGLTPEVTPTVKMDKFMDGLEESVKMESTDKKREKIADLGKLTKGKKVVKQKSAVDLLEEEERITQYGKKVPESKYKNEDSGKVLSEDQVKFVEDHKLSKECVEHLMSFMG